MICAGCLPTTLPLSPGARSATGRDVRLTFPLQEAVGVGRVVCWRLKTVMLPLQEGEGDN